MDTLIITGGAALHGCIAISGAKNAALPLMAAGLLSAEPLILLNVPDLADIRTMRGLLEQHGARVEAGQGADGARMILRADAITQFTAPYERVRTMRASVLVLGPLLARFGQAKVSLPGGCAIGTRPIDLHLKALAEMGAEIRLEDGYVHAHAPGGLRGADILFDKVSVGATENTLMAACVAKGVTVLRNAAREPEVQDLARCLVAMGAKIEGIGTNRMTVEGVEGLHGASHTVISDRIEAGSFAAAAAITGGAVELAGVQAGIMQATLEKLEAAGVEVRVSPQSVHIARSGPLRGIDIMTQPYPGFATDMQAQCMAMLALAEGASLVTETIFENRFMHVPELVRMGANITVHGASAMVRGVPSLSGAEVMATDLRASVCLVIAALAAKGTTRLHRLYHLDRGYERLVEKLAACGARIERVREPVASGAETEQDAA